MTHSHLAGCGHAYTCSNLVHDGPLHTCSVPRRDNCDICRRDYVLKQGLFNRWIIAHPSANSYAWSGSRWVIIGGIVQVCNFESQDDAHEYAKSMGMEPLKQIGGAA